MVLKVYGTGSSGNCYLLTAGTESLLLDAGVSPAELWKDMGFAVKYVAGCLVTHEHGDHAAHAGKFAKLGIPVYASAGTIEAISEDCSLTQFNSVRALQSFSVGNFTVMPFDAQHDASEPLGYLIRYNPTGETVLYATDTYYLKNTFPGVHYWIVECNYVESLVDEQADDGKLSTALRRRLMKSHMSLRRLLDMFEANDLSKTRSIALVHLSDERSDERMMVKAVKEATGIHDVYAAANGMVYAFELNPF